MARNLLRVLPLVALFVFSACSDSLVGDQYSESGSVTATAAPDSKLRHQHLLGDAHSEGGTAGKWGADGKTHLFVALNTIDADGVSRRVLDQWSITRRILNEYGVTRRILDRYGLTQEVLEGNGVTRRVLEAYEITIEALAPYGITPKHLSKHEGDINDDFLSKYGVTVGELGSQGVTPRILTDYGVTRRVLTEYGLTPADLQKELDKAVSSMKLKVRVKNGVPGISVKVEDAALQAILDELMSDPRILFVEPDVEMSGTPLLREQNGRGMDQVVPWNIEQLGVLATDYDAQAVDIYVLDSGVLGTSGERGSKTDLDVVEQKDFTMLFENREQDLFDDDFFEPLPYFDPGQDGNPSDLSGHGTHVAGILGAIDNDHGVIGAAPGARIHSLKVLTDDGRTDVTTVVAAIDYVVHARKQNPNRPMVMNLSLGTDTQVETNSVVDDAVERAIDAGIVVVVSAGNSGADARTFSPAHVERAITVGAYDRSMKRTGFSNYGPHVDLFAPGDAIISLSNRPEDYGRDSATIMESGTSMAAPHVAGAAAQYLALHPAATPDEVRDALVSYGLPEIFPDADGTTNLRIFLGEFARDASKDKAFKVKADWKTGKDGNELKLKGEGRRALKVSYIDATSGDELASTFVDEKAKWEIVIVGLGAPPCSAVFSHDGATIELDLTEGGKKLKNCSSAEGSLVSTVLQFEKAEWKPDGRGKGLKLELVGVAESSLSLLYGESGDPLFSAEFNKEGDFKHTLDISDPTEVPCTVTAVSAGESVTVAVDDAPAQDCRP